MGELSNSWNAPPAQRQAESRRSRAPDVGRKTRFLGRVEQALAQVPRQYRGGFETGGGAALGQSSGAERIENIGKDSMLARCLPLGPQYTTDADSTGGGMMKISQTPSLIIILNPDLTYRQIYMDGRPLESSPNPSWMGYSVGHWDGDTLVVESFGFNDRTWLDTSGHPHTEALRMTERYRRRDFGHLDLEVTLQDPAVYSRPWTVAVQAELAADTELLEYVCNENTPRPGALGGQGIG